MHTERLRLRRPGPDDLQAFLAYRNDPANLRLQPIAPMEEGQALAFLVAQSRLDVDADNCWTMFAIERIEDGRMIGEVGIYIEAAAEHAGDMGWSLHRDACGQGYATEAAKRLVDYAFAERGLLRLTASMSAHNRSSIRVCERLGMRREATASNAQCVAGGWHDVYRYALSHGEWAP
nr:GNAT family protein [uncultured Massilia sp.]